MLLSMGERGLYKFKIDYMALGIYGTLWIWRGKDAVDSVKYLLGNIFYK